MLADKLSAVMLSYLVMQAAVTTVVTNVVQ